jgi:hypothetical protein
MSLTLFQNTATQITDMEKAVIIPLIIDALAFKSEKNTVTSKNMSAYLRACKYNVSEARVRKLISFISSMGIKRGLVEDLGDKVIIGAGNGYFVTDDPRVVDDQIEDLIRRIDTMRSRIDSLRAQRQNLIYKRSA